eukprot:TRINITY_DN7386_c0_g2_i1.p1 TRINITY_DN7386_c0_g2~~TRINITY_DN7386_c0_g2_i1.p1  ORF type:complete len:166 (+),score=17.68 TRINITY_DN7386_c0_g2_i1:167-664(+)
MLFQTEIKFYEVKYILRGVVNYYGRHYVTFLQDHSWYSIDDSQVKEVGSWASVVDKCLRGRLQPILLIFQRLNIENVYQFKLPKKRKRESPPSSPARNYKRQKLNSFKEETSNSNPFSNMASSDGSEEFVSQVLIEEGGSFHKLFRRLFQIFLSTSRALLRFHRA